MNGFKANQALICTLFVLGCVATCMGNTLANSWIYLARDAKTMMQSCPTNETTSYLTCLKHGSLELFDRMTSVDVIPLTQQLRLTRHRENDIDNDEMNEVKRTTSKSLYAMKSQDVDSNGFDNVTWANHVMKRFLDVLSTHTIQLDLTEKSRGRARHRRNQMLPMMAFGITALGMVLVPMGFQFLAVLGGKALLLAKMALLLASINGIKRVATSGVHYGFYHTDPHLPPPGPQVWERSEQAYNRPRAAGTQIS